MGALEASLWLLSLSHWYVGHNEHIPQAPDQLPGLETLVYPEGTENQGLLEQHQRNLLQ